MQKHLMLSVPAAVFMLSMTVTSHLNWAEKVRSQNSYSQAQTDTVLKQKLDSQIAQDRYDNGCYRLVARNSNNTPVQIKQNMPVFGRGNVNDKTPIADGITVCDAFGGTGIIKNGKITQFAASPNFIDTNKPIK